MEILKITNEACIGCGACQAIESEAFFINEEGIAEVTPEYKNKDITNSEIKETINEAIDNCPTEAIKKEEN